MSKVMGIYDFLRGLILPLEQIDYYLPNNGTIIDLGCGQGIICKFLAKSPNRWIVGVDANVKRLPKTEFNNLKFISADITKYKIKNAEGIILSDVLHHIDLKNQKALLKNIGKSLKPGGVLIIKEIDSGEFIRSKLSRLWDFVLYPKDIIYYWKSVELKKFLQSLRFRVKIERASRLFPGSTTLFICTK